MELAIPTPSLDDVHGGLSTRESVSDGSKFSINDNVPLAFASGMGMGIWRR